MSGITTKECLRRGCPKLKEYVFFGRVSRLCSITGRIPGNMPACPMDVDKLVIV